MSGFVNIAHTSHTWREIQAQPGIWRDWAGEMPLSEIRSWIAEQDIQQV